MLETKDFAAEQSELKFNTRSLLLITTWAALCYATIFVNQSLLTFHVARLIGQFAIVVSAVLPLFLDVKYRKFWNAYSVAVIAYLSYSFMHSYSNPVVTEAVTVVSRPLKFRDYFDGQLHGVDYYSGCIGRITAVYHLLEMHFVVMFGILVGLVWQSLKDQTPLWIVGVWVFFLARNMADDYSENHYFLSTLATIALLPTVANFEGRRRPFWTTFGVFAFVIGIEAVASKSYDFAYYVNEVVRFIAPVSSSSMAESITLLGVPVVASVAGLIVQVVVNKQEATAPRKGD